VTCGAADRLTIFSPLVIRVAAVVAGRFGRSWSARLLDRLDTLAGAGELLDPTAGAVLEGAAGIALALLSLADAHCRRLKPTSPRADSALCTARSCAATRQVIPNFAHTRQLIAEFAN
jgi:hypothetical protein